MNDFPKPGRSPSGARDEGPMSGLQCRDVTVRFGELIAVDAVTASFPAGGVHVLVGQNGAGKTSLSRVLGGLIRPSGGEVLVGGEKLQSGSVTDARRHGVELVHQHFALPEGFSVAEVFELFNANPRGFLGSFTASRLERETRDLLAEAGIRVDPHAKIEQLPVETRQAIEITRALAGNPQVLVLDEPTAVLLPEAIERLFARLHELAARGLCVIVVLHKLAEVAAVADTVSVLRAGRMVLPPTPAAKVGQHQLAKMIMGDAPTSNSVLDVPRPDPAAPTVLRLSSVSGRTAEHDAPIRDVSLAVRRGEIVGIAGIEGNGQRALAEAIIGLSRPESGDVEFAGRSVGHLSVAQRRAAGVRAIPFERNTEGVSSDNAIWENFCALGEDHLISPRRLRAHCREALDSWGVAYRSEAEPIGDLSGGNVQRVVLARELSGSVELLLAAHPTRGLDVGGTQYVHHALVDAARKGTGIVLISSDLDELFEISHRIIVFLGGRAVTEFAPPFDIQAVGRAMTGSHVA